MKMADVRQAGSDDISILTTLMTEFYAEAGFELSREVAGRAFTALLDSPEHGQVWILEENGNPAGYLVLTFGFSMEFGGTRAFIDDLFVRPISRNKGLGSNALAQIREVCRGLGVRAVLVETGPNDHPARRLYHRAGFEANGRVLLSQALARAVHEIET